MEHLNWLSDNNVAAWVSDDGRRQLPFELPSVTFGSGNTCGSQALVYIFIISFESVW